MRRATAHRPLAVAVDVGTTGARAAAYGLDGTLVAEVRHRYRTNVPRPGWAEQDARDWQAGAMAVLGRLAAKVAGQGEWRAIGLTGQCPTVVPVDQHGKPVGPGMLYRDNRAVAEAAEMREAIGPAEYHRRTGHVPEAFHVGAKVLWLKKHESERYARAACFLQPRDVVLHRLTGALATDETHANATLFYDLVERHWDKDLLAAFQVDPALFPVALPSWQVVAGLPAAVADEFALPAGTPVVIGAADSQCAAYGAGITTPGIVSEMAGASSCLNSVVPSPLADLRVTHYRYLMPDCYCTELGVNTTGAAIDWAVRRLGYADHAALAADAERHYRRAGRLDPIDAAPLFLPYLGDGERDDPSVRGAFLGLADRHDRAALAYAVLEGVALAVTAVVQELADAGSPARELRVGGGGTHLRLVGQLKAELLGIPVLHLDLDPADFGAAMLAAASAGLADAAANAIDAVVRRAVTLHPTTAGQRRERARLDWFLSIRTARAVHRPASVVHRPAAVVHRPAAVDHPRDVGVVLAAGQADAGPRAGAERPESQ
ncbi:MAG TPA: FGGY family carbohydrate kinase [Streptosporangiaceae bacterium]|nr:FGGY family carbohydrate kinase [Streptosporangiaceae bacterium]